MVEALVHDTQKLGWRRCRNEPCLMTWQNDVAQGRHIERIDVLPRRRHHALRCLRRPRLARHGR
eukprot:705769-Prorocentrum_lima.AAC.1